MSIFKLHFQFVKQILVKTKNRKRFNQLVFFSQYTGFLKRNLPLPLRLILKAENSFHESSLYWGAAFRNTRFSILDFKRWKGRRLHQKCQHILIVLYREKNDVKKMKLSTVKFLFINVGSPLILEVSLLG